MRCSSSSCPPRPTTTPGSCSSPRAIANGPDPGSTFPSTTRRIMPGRWSWRCMAAAAPGAFSCGAGCAMPRSRGVILVAPTSVGSTWALTGPDVDTPNIARILELVRSRWNVDGARMLLTGMSDGGTFTYVSGLEAESPFTHLAPVAAAFHPLLAQMADADRTRGLPIHIAHGALDWMFPVELARQAQRALSRAGAVVTYRQVDDLSHCYPRELNATLLEWLATTPPKRSTPER